MFMCGHLLFPHLWRLISSQAYIHRYKNETFITQANARYFQGGNEGLYTSSFIRFDDVTFVRTIESAMQPTTGLVEAIVLGGKDRDRIGSVSLKNYDAVVCCTPEFAETGSCSLGEVIIRRDPVDPEWPIRIKTFFKGNMTEAKMSPRTVFLKKTGSYFLYFMICDAKLDGTVIRGKTIWKNPDGYLSAKVAPLKNFYGFMSLAYLLLGLVWCLKLFKLWKDVSIPQLHHHISLVIAFGIYEMANEYFEYAHFNATGTRCLELTLWSVTLTSIKRTLSKLLVLLVSMGYYGVVKLPTLGGMFSWVRILGVAIVYIVPTATLELFEHLCNLNEYPGNVMICLLVAVALLDAFLILCLSIFFVRTLDTLKIDRNMAMLKPFSSFTNAVVIYTLISMVWFCFEVYLYCSDILIEVRPTWIIPAVWNLLFYCMLALQCAIWAPGNYGQTNMQEIELQNLIRENVM